MSTFYHGRWLRTTVYGCAGATFFDWTKDGVDGDEETPVQLQLDADIFAAELEAKGVGTDRPVVVSSSTLRSFLDALYAYCHNSNRVAKGLQCSTTR